LLFANLLIALGKLPRQQCYNIKIQKLTHWRFTSVHYLFSASTLGKVK